jgi:hypothetical protein
MSGLLSKEVTNRGRTQALSSLPLKKCFLLKKILVIGNNMQHRTSVQDRWHLELVN